MKRTICALALTLGVFGCRCSSATPTSSSPGLQNATCSGVCANGARLGCDFAKPTPGNGEPCASVCERDQPIFKRDLACRASATTCTKLDACN